MKMSRGKKRGSGMRDIIAMDVADKINKKRKAASRTAFEAAWQRRLKKESSGRANILTIEER